MNRSSLILDLPKTITIFALMCACVGLHMTTTEMGYGGETPPTQTTKFVPRWKREKSGENRIIDRSIRYRSQGSLK